MAIQLVGSRFEYILQDDKDSAQPSVFYIKELNARERREAADKFVSITIPEDADMSTLVAVNSRMCDAYMDICKLTYISVAPILDHHGHEIDVGIEDVLNRIPSDHIIKELALAAIGANRLSEDEVKKSKTLPEPGQQD